MSAPRAVLFDMDGVLVDSYRPHFESWRRLGEERGVVLTEEQFATTFGQTSRDILARFFDLGPGPEAAAADARKEALYREIVRVEFPAMPGARALIDALAADGWRLAVGSSGPAENIALALELLQRTAAFGATVCGQDVSRGKPDPEVFVRAAERLAVAPSRCVVIEDAVHGLEAAHAAGMTAVGLASTGRSREELAAAAPALVVETLGELSAARLAGLLPRS